MQITDSVKWEMKKRERVCLFTAPPAKW